MAEFAAMPLWTDAYLGDTTHLTTIEHGAYLLLLMAMWRNDGNLPDDDKLLARYARLTGGQWARISPTVRAFFTVENGSIYQSRLTDELNAVRQHSKRQSDNVKARWLKTKETTDTAVIPNTPSGNTPLPLPLPIEKEEAKASSKKRGTRLPDDWFLPKSWGEWAAGEGWSIDVIRTEADNFKDYWMARAGPTASKLDWEATWRVWIRKSPKTSKPQGGQNAQFGAAIHQLADRLSQGSVDLADDRRNPFAVRPGRNIEAGK
jgi:uncharacterized protein YdaU (DUF1376 family)